MAVGWAWVMALIVSAGVGIICASLGYSAGRRDGYQAGLAAALAIHARYVHGEDL